MSQLKVNGIRHTSASSDAITLVSDGTATAKITNNLSNRRLNINGAMQVNQRGSVSISSDGYGGVDRYSFVKSGAAVATVTKDSDVPTGQGFGSSMKIDITTLDDQGASDYFHIRHKLEGQDCQAIKKGTSNAEQLSLQFWIKSTITGTYVVNLYDSDNNRHVGATYTVSSADTWEKKTITFPADTTGALGNDNNNSLEIRLHLEAGSNFTSGTLPTSWAGYSDANTAVGQVNAVSSTSNNIYFTGLQLEIGDVNTDFEHRSYGEELNRCLRYYYRMPYKSGTFIGVGPAWNTDSSGGTFSVPVPMRVSPTFTVNAGGDFETTQVFGDTQTCSAVSMPYGSSFPHNMMSWRGESNGNHDDGESYILRFKDGQTSGYISLSAEL